MSTGSISVPYIIPLRVEQLQKFPIYTNTLIEIRCNTNDVDIYYTLDGSKPDSFITLTTRRSTIQYIKPFYIPRELATAGKVTVKAIAVSRDGVRESVVVTRVFDIKIVPSDHVQSDEYENRYLYELQQERQDLMRKIQEENEQIQQKISESMHRSAIDSFVQENSSQYAQANRFKYDINVLRCAHCFMPKTNDSYTRFCTECGLPWQKLTQNQPENYSSKICTNCKSAIPFNSDACVVCETPKSIEPQRRPNIQNQPKILCPQCKSANPTNFRTCYICDSALLPTSTPEKRASVSVPTPPPQQTSTIMTCSKCFRLNNADARFCDWCGAFPERTTGPVQCTKCCANNDPSAKFCSTCGCVMEPPLRVIDTRLRNSLNIPATSMIASALTRHSASPTWLNANTTLSHYPQPSLMPKTEAATQTYGIYYPNAKDLDLLIKQNKQILAEQELQEYRPALKPVSPGHGYWRQQVDHIYAHLKNYSVNRPDFQSLIGEPRMGQMVHATVQETENQITFQAVFRKPENLTQSSFYTNETNEYYPIRGERSSAFSNIINSDGEYTRERPQRTKVKHPPKKRPQSATVPSTDSPSHALIQLLEKKSSDYKRTSHGIVVLNEVRRLLRDKKVDTNVRNRDGYTVLQLAVRNGHHDCLEILIKDGRAKLDIKGPRGNTALHECCLLGVGGIDALRILLEHGGDELWKNDKNESVVDVASKQNCPELIQVIAKHRAEKMISRQTKDYYDDRARTKSVHDRRSAEYS